MPTQPKPAAPAAGSAADPTKPPEGPGPPEGSSPAPEPPPPPAQIPAVPLGGGQPISITQTEYQSLLDERTRRMQLEAEQKEIAEKAEADRIRLQMQSGQYEEGLRAIEERHKKDKAADAAKFEQLERQMLEREKSLVVAQAMAPIKFLNQFAAAQAKMALEAKCEVIRDHKGEPQVIDRQSRQAAAEAMVTHLAGPEFAHLIEAKTKGGPNQGSSATDGGNPTPPEQETFEQVIIRQWREGQDKAAATGWQGNIVDQAKYRRRMAEKNSS
jgi:hypothetical protein